MTHIKYRVNVLFSSHGQRIPCYISVIFKRSRLFNLNGSLVGLASISIHLLLEWL